MFKTDAAQSSSNKCKKYQFTKDLLTTLKRFEYSLTHVTAINFFRCPAIEFSRIFETVNVKPRKNASCVFCVFN